jgi:hypothetical protein
LIDYFVCGLCVRSELLLPGILKAATSSCGVDVHIRRTPVPMPYSTKHGKPLNWSIDDDYALFRVPESFDFGSAAAVK